LGGVFVVFVVWGGGVFGGVGCVGGGGGGGVGVGGGGGGGGGTTPAQCSVKTMKLNTESVETKKERSAKVLCTTSA